MNKLVDFFQLQMDKDPLGYFLPVFLLLIVIEFLSTREKRKGYYLGKDTTASLIMAFGTGFVGFTMKFLAFMAFTFLHSKFAIFPNISSFWWSWIIIFFLDDLTFYWHHRLSHEVRILWAAHVNHHSSEYYNLGTALRQSWTEQIYKFAFWMYMPIIGFEPIQILTMVTINLIFQFFPHTQIIKKFPKFIEFIFNTPSHHRVHHASNIRYLDRNHAGILIIWDRIFGTFAEESEEEKPIYGITSNINTFNPFKIAFHEFSDIFKDVRRAQKFSDKLKYIFMPPGWSHDGEDLRAKTLRKQLKSES